MLFEYLGLQNLFEDMKHENFNWQNIFDDLTTLKNNLTWTKLFWLSLFFFLLALDTTITEYEKENVENRRQHQRAAPAKAYIVCRNPPDIQGLLRKRTTDWSREGHMPSGCSSSEQTVKPWRSKRELHMPSGRSTAQLPLRDR
jgi:hypothetical protein